MSLIIGKVIDDNILMLGDTKLTFEHKVNSNPFIDGCLKQYIVSDKLAIAFAGNTEHFRYEAASLLNCRSSDEILQVTLQAQKCGAEFQLMVAEIGCPYISTLKAGVLCQSEVGYIGDSIGFDCFQRNLHNSAKDNSDILARNTLYLNILRIPESLKSGEVYRELFNTLKKVIWDEDVPTVGGAIIPLCSDNGKFSYMNYADVISDPIKFESHVTTPRAIDFGTPQSGGYTVEFNDNSVDAGDGREVGFYFLQGGFGVYFPSDSSGFRKAEVIRANNPANWNLQTKKLIGTTIYSQYLTVDHCGIAAEECIGSNNFLDAISYFEMADLQTLNGRPHDLVDRFFFFYANTLIQVGRPQNARNLLISALQAYIRLPNCHRLLSNLG